MEDFLKEIKGSTTDYPIFVKEPEKIINVKNRIAIVNQEELNNRKNIKMAQNQPLLLKNLFVESLKKKESKDTKNQKKNTKNKKHYVTKSILKLKSTPVCPPGQIRSVKTGKCIKIKKKQTIHYDSVENILKEINI